VLAYDATANMLAGNDKRPAVVTSRRSSAIIRNGGPVLWSLGEGPRLREVQHFTNAGDLRVWLKAIAVEDGHKNIPVPWTDGLKTNTALTHLLTACLVIPVPMF
jgi:hypothetical protein